MIKMPDSNSLLALRSLRDLKVVRAGWWHPGFRQLRNQHLVNWREVRWTPSGERATDLFDYSLNDLGFSHARLDLRPWPPINFKGDPSDYVRR